MRDLYQEHIDWRQRRAELVDMFAKSMFIEYDIKEITTDIQKKNGTRQFVLPNGVELASYASGYVRRCNSSDRIYQLNKVYKREQRYTIISGKELKTVKYIAHVRELIHNPLARLMYIVDFCKRNYNMKNLIMY